MLDRRTILGGLSLAASAAATETAARIPTTGAPAVRSTSAADRLNAFGPEADRLSARTGLWDAVETVWAEPSSKPVQTAGLIAERVMYGSLLQEIMRPAGDGARGTVARTDLLAFNRLEGRWGYVSFDTRAPVGLMPAWSSDAGDAQTITLSFAPFAAPGSGPDTGGRLLRMEQIIRFTDADHEVKDQYFMLADGEATRWLAHRYAYSRRK